MVDLQKYMAIAHQDHSLCSPLSLDHLAQIIPLLDLKPGTRVLDIGCSKAELLIQMAERCQIVGTGIDISEAFIQAAREAIDTRAPGADITLLQQDITDYDLAASDPFDVVICIGSTHLYGGYVPTLKALKEAVNPGGILVVGDLYWRKKPEPPYLDALKLPEDAFTAFAEYPYLGADEGFIPIYSTSASEADWDHYEWLTYRAIEHYARENPDDDDSPIMLERIHEARDRYLKWGRYTMGFGLHLLEKPPE